MQQSRAGRGRGKIKIKGKEKDSNPGSSKSSNVSLAKGCNLTSSKPDSEVCAHFAVLNLYFIVFKSVM